MEVMILNELLLVNCFLFVLARKFVGHQRIFLALTGFALGVIGLILLFLDLLLLHDQIRYWFIYYK